MEIIKGYTYMHEHMYIDLSKVKQDSDCTFDATDEIILELKECYALGLRNIVEVSNRGMGRDIAIIERIERETKLNIIKSTGYYKVPFLPEEFNKLSEEELADIMVDEITKEINNGVKACVIGEIGTSNNTWEDEEIKLFNAAIIAHKKTNAPIYTHTTLGTLAISQADYFIKQGVDPKKVIIGHIDLSKDLNVIIDVLDKGFYVGFDTVGKNNYFPDEQRIDFLIEIEKRGQINQVMLSQDLTRKSHLEVNGGIGYAYLLKTFIPMAIEKGLSKEAIDTMLIENPQRFFKDYE